MASADVDDMIYIERVLRPEGVLYVRLILVDYSNIIRARVMPIAQFCGQFDPETGKPTGLSMASVNATLPMYADIILPELTGLFPYLSAVGEFVLVPDAGTIRKLPYGTGTHAICHGNLKAKECISGKRDLDLCPRTCLKRIVE